MPTEASSEALPRPQQNHWAGSLQISLQTAIFVLHRARIGEVLEHSPEREKSITLHQKQ